MNALAWVLFGGCLIVAGAAGWLLNTLARELSEDDESSDPS